MKTLGEAAMELPWLAPSVASMTMLARSSLPSVWLQVRTDPGVVLLLARLLEKPVQTDFPSDATILEALLRHQSHFQLGFVDWSQAGPAAILRACQQNGLVASQLAAHVGCDEWPAWMAGFLAPIGWLAMIAADSGDINVRPDLSRNKNTAWQRDAWGHDHTAIARRMCRAWRLPTWLSAIVGNLGLPAGIAEKLGAPAKLFAVVQLATQLLQVRGNGLGLTVGASTVDLLNALHLDADEVDALADSAVLAEVPARTWESPAKFPLLPDLLQLALENRRKDDAAWIERLQQDLDCLQNALVQQCAEEHGRLQTAKIAALAEFAAGAGHEINNPLAVISGQAQYVLKQLDWLEVPAEEIENVGEYLDNLRLKVEPCLNKIIGQTKRVHSILTDLMQFARPQKPKLQSVSARSLIQEAMHSLQGLAQEHKVTLTPAEIDHDENVHADLSQSRIALCALLRNAIEAAPADGWAGIRVEKKTGAMLDLIVEDSGTGPTPASCEHLFDPFFSGRSAGRGRGMGLPTAWRFARLQGGEVRFDGNEHGTTRFVLSLPLAPIAAVPSYTTDLGASNGRNGVHAVAVNK